MVARSIEWGWEICQSMSRVSEDHSSIKGTNAVIHFAKLPMGKSCIRSIWAQQREISTGGWLFLWSPKAQQHHSSPCHYSSEVYFCSPWNPKYVGQWQWSSVCLPGNDQAERAVKTVEQLLEHSADRYMALLSYQATPLPSCGLSPAELLMGRRIKTDVPQMQIGLSPRIPEGRWSQQEETKRELWQETSSSFSTTSTEQSTCLGWHSRRTRTRKDHWTGKYSSVLPCGSTLWGSL